MQIPYWEEMAGYSDWSQPYLIWSCMTRLGPRHIAVFRSRSDMAYIVLSIFQQGLRVHELHADGQKHTLLTGIPEISRP